MTTRYFIVNAIKESDVQANAKLDSYRMIGYDEYKASSHEMSRSCDCRRCVEFYDELESLK